MIDLQQTKKRPARQRHDQRSTLVTIATVVTIFSGVPIHFFVNAGWRDKHPKENLPPGYVDDASRMNSTHVSEVWAIPADPPAAESQLRQLLERARNQKRHVTISGARHSMGGHTIYPDGIVLNMLPFNRMDLDEHSRILRVGAGARWADVIPYLDRRGFSVAIMQSNNDFSVGGSLSVNCHGWQPNRPPIASTVHSFRLMKADGTIVRCSRLENAELFSLVLGGYGLFGIILDADLQVVPNERYKAETEVLPARDYVVRFAEQVDRAPVDVGLAYGRSDIVPGEKTFLQEAILTVFRRCPCKKEEIPPLKDESYAALRRDIYRAQIGSDSGKKLRWQAEKKLAPLLDRHFVCRNQLLDEPVELYQERSAERTDIIHEYFIAPDQVPVFLDRVRAIVPKHRGDLLNVTVRDVRQDKDTFLRYADRDMFGFVMLFTQRRTPDADSAMEAMTRDLIDAAFQSGGRYYLPYRLHAAKEQFTRAYPQASAFFERKRRYDPDELFQNRFYMKYALP